MGWLGDRAMGASGEMFLFDVQAFYRKWLGDILAAQSPDGCVPDVAPPYWPDALRFMMRSFNNRNDY